MNPTQQISVPSALLDNMIQYVEVSSLMGKRALDEIDVHRAGQQKAAALRNPLLDYMVQQGVVAEHQKEAAQAMLGSHAETMQLLKAAIDKIVDLRKNGTTKTAGAEPGEAVDPNTLGATSPVGGANGYTAGDGFVAPLTKQGEYDSLNDVMVGRKTNLVKASDKPLLALIGR